MGVPARTFMKGDGELRTKHREQRNGLTDNTALFVTGCLEEFGKLLRCTDGAIDGLTDIKVKLNTVRVYEKRSASFAWDTDIKWRRTIPKLGQRIHVCAIKGCIVGSSGLPEGFRTQKERQKAKAREG